MQAAEAGQMLAAHLAEMFPEVEQKGQPTPVPWDTNNEFTVSKLMCYIHMNGAAGKYKYKYKFKIEGVFSRYWWYLIQY